MRIPRRGSLPLNLTLPAARLCVIGLTVVVSGCAAHQSPSYVNGPQARPQHIAAVSKEDLEDDGRPAQVPPLQRSIPEEDDPTQPWSPNYGGPSNAPGQPTGQPSMLKPKPQPKSRGKTYDAMMEPPAPMPAPMPVRMSRVEEDSVIARAISAHEMRNQ
jgi:hypothetical protein